jgi:hypothetical protein
VIAEVHGDRHPDRYLDLLKPQRTRYEVFDTIVPGFAICVTPAVIARTISPRLAYEDS